jgi:N-formylglutamate amidohydrolase
MRTSKTWFLPWLTLVPVTFSGLVVVGQEKEIRVASDLVAVQQGALPIILSAPHGGDKPIPGVPVRTGEGLVKGPSGFVTSRDSGTEQLCYEVAKAIEAKMGKKPYYVAARFHRKFLDPNRPGEIGYEHPLAKPVYQEYHETLARFCREVKKNHGRGLLLDIHGQASARDTVFRGTKNGKTVALLIERHGDKAHIGPKSFFGLMDAQKMKVFPTDDSKERSGFTGGYIVQTYGSKTFAIDAIQLEFGGDYRAKDNQKATAAKLATAVDAFARMYLFEGK